MPIFLSRHGQTQWNLSGRLQGHLDSPLTQAGIQQAQVLASKSASLGISRVISSDLGRAIHTAKIVAEFLNCPVSSDRGLRERNLGEIQGIDNDNEEKLWQAFDDRFLHDEIMIPGAESASTVANRIINTLQKLQVKYADENLLIVGHGEWLRIFMNVQSGLSPWSHYHSVPGNGELIELNQTLLECA